MKFGKLMGAAVVGAAMMAAMPAEAKIYNFSGVLQMSYLFNPNPLWDFSVGQKFSGSIDYDPTAITLSWDYINTPNQKLSYYYSPVRSLTFSIGTLSGTYSHQVPQISPQGYDMTLAGVFTSNQPYSLNGLGVIASNYTINGSPVAPVPATSFVGTYYPHSVFLDFSQYVSSGLLVNSTSPNIDLSSLFNSIHPDPLYDPYGAMFTVRFSDPAHWPPQAETIDGIISGRITSFSAAEDDVAAVPEPATWALMIVGFGAIGSAMRRRQRPRCAGLSLT